MKRKSLELSNYRALSLGSLHETWFVKVEYSGTATEDIVASLADADALYDDLAKWVKERGGQAEKHS